MRGRLIVLLVALVLAQALAQGALVWLAPRDPFAAESLVLAAVSALVVLAAASAAWVLAAAVTRAPGRTGARIGWTVAAVAVAGIAAVVLAPAVVVVAAVAGPVLAGGGLRGAGRLVRRHPVRSILLALATVLAVVLAWVGSALAGLLLTGPAGSAAAWLGYGAVLAGFAVAWCALAARPVHEPVPRPAEHR